MVEKMILIIKLLRYEPLTSWWWWYNDDHPACAVLDIKNGHSTVVSWNVQKMLAAPKELLRELYKEVLEDDDE